MGVLGERCMVGKTISDTGHPLASIVGINCAEARYVCTDNGFA